MQQLPTSPPPLATPPHTCRPYSFVGETVHPSHAHRPLLTASLHLGWSAWLSLILMSFKSCCHFLPFPAPHTPPPSPWHPLVPLWPPLSSKCQPGQSTRGRRFIFNFISFIYFFSKFRLLSPSCDLLLWLLLLLLLSSFVHNNNDRVLSITHTQTQTNAHISFHLSCNLAMAGSNAAYTQRPNRPDTLLAPRLVCSFRA